MFDSSCDFDSPGYLLWILPVWICIWLISRSSLSSLGPVRRWFALGLRMLVSFMLVAALAEPNYLTLGKKLAVMFLVDGSASITREESEQAIAYVNEAAKQRDTQREDRAGVILFGREAASEIPPVAQPWQIQQFESLVEPQFTNLAAAMEIAQATLPADCAKRVVIVSDGNANLGQAEEQAERLLQAGVGIDVVPIRYERTGDVAVDKIVSPTEVARGVPFDLRVVINNASATKSVKGKLTVVQEASGARQTIADDEITVPPGKHVLTIRQQPEESGFFTYEAAFFPTEKSADQHVENNRATAFSRILGRGRVLMIEDAAQPGRFDDVVKRLQAEELEVVVRPSVSPFESLADLQQFDTVIMADVPRFSASGEDTPDQFTDEQIRTLVQNTERFGCGLVVLGGPSSYGAGGWANTELEKALPVDCQIKNLKVQLVGALVLVIDHSGSMSGDKLLLSKAAAAETAKMLGPYDFLGVVTFDDSASWVLPLQRNNKPDNARRRIARIQEGGGTNMMPGMKLGYDALTKVESAVKHMIVLTDGQTAPGDFLNLTRQMKQAGITTTGIAIGPDADRQLLADISRVGGGKFYHVNNPRAIPRVFMHEARRVALPLVYEDERGFAPQVDYPGELLAGIPGPLPPITGFVMTTIKQSPLVELMLTAPAQPSPNNTILAAWQYGLGRTVALTTDVGQRWASSWKEWANYDKLLAQTVRWSMRRSQQDERLAMSVEARDGVMRVVVTALDEQQSDVNGLVLNGSLVKDKETAVDVQLQQTAPGRYVAEFPAEEAGNYYLAVSGGTATAPLRSAVSIPHTAEFDDRQSNETLLVQLAERVPRGGEKGSVIVADDGLEDTQSLLKTNVFRSGVAPATERTPIWPWALLVAACLFWGDVFCRRVHVDLSWIGPAWTAALDKFRLGKGTSESKQEDSRMARLKQRKSETAQTFAPQTPLPRDASDQVLDDASQATAASQGSPARSATPAQTLTPKQGEASEDSYIGRLQAAKRRAMKDKD